MACIEITDADFDDVHHALGRPDLLTLQEGENYRNHYCVEIDSDTARRFDLIGFWTLARRINDGRDGVYVVNADGKSALADWLTLQPDVAAPAAHSPVIDGESSRAEPLNPSETNHG